tara:strand:- start:536 stop:928 length:393 start_codon:yes stop_codon:yes gene_type:complete
MKSKFEEKFNVGDKVYLHEWSKKDSKFKIQWIKILSFEGETDINFTAKRNTGEIEGDWSASGINWKLYKEPVKKDLIDVKVVYKIIKESYGLSLISYLVDDEMLDNWKEHNPQTEYITKKEAIERGLKID